MLSKFAIMFISIKYLFCIDASDNSDNNSLKGKLNTYLIEEATILILYLEVPKPKEERKFSKYDNPDEEWSPAPPQFYSVKKANIAPLN